MAPGKRFGDPISPVCPPSCKTLSITQDLSEPLNHIPRKTMLVFSGGDTGRSWEMWDLGPAQTLGLHVLMKVTLLFDSIQTLLQGAVGVFSIP